MSHYYTTDRTLEHSYQTVTLKVRGIMLSLVTDRGVFSRNNIDFGSRVLLDHLTLDHVHKALDVGCGYGPIGLFMARYNEDAHITMIDVNERAIELVQKNIDKNKIKNANVCKSDLFEQITETFDLIVTNPPIRAGKDTVFNIYEGAYDHLVEGGSLQVVIQKKQGAPSSVKKLEALFGNCEIVTKNKGYWVLLAKKQKSG